MVSPALIDWVKKQEAKGYTSQQIYLYLVNNGYDQKDVIEAINYSNSTNGNYIQMPSPNAYQPPKVVPKKKHKIGLIIFLIIFTLLFAAGFYLYKTGLYVTMVDPILKQYGIPIPWQSVNNNPQPVMNDTTTQQTPTVDQLTQYQNINAVQNSDSSQNNTNNTQ